MLALNQNLVKIETSKAFYTAGTSITRYDAPLIYREGDDFYNKWMHQKATLRLGLSVPEGLSQISRHCGPHAIMHFPRQMVFLESNKMGFYAALQHLWL